MFEAQLKRDGVFQKVIHHLKVFLSDTVVHLQCNADEITLGAMDSARGFLVAVSIDPRMVFDSYKCEETVTLVFPLRVLSRALKNNQMNGHGPLRLLTCHSNQRVDSLSALGERSEGVIVYDIMLSDQPYQRFSYPEHTWACTVSMPTTELTGILRYFSHLSHVSGDVECAICVTSDGVAFTTWCDFLTTTKLVRKSPDVTILINDPIQEMIFLLRHLKRFCPPENYAQTVSFSLHPMAPIMLEYPLQENSSSNNGPELTHCGHAKLFLEARIDDEDHPFPDPMTLSTKTHANTVIEARIECKSFSQILDVLAGSFHRIRLTFLEDELHIHAIYDPPISLPDIGVEIDIEAIVNSRRSVDISICVSSNGFNSFRCDHPLSFDLEMFALNMALEKTGDDDILTLTAKNDPRTLRVVVESPLRNELTIQEVTLYNTNDPLVTRTFPYMCTIMMPSTMLEHIIRDMKGENCVIGVTKEGALFSADSGSHSILDTGQDQIFFDVKEPLQMTFCLNELKIFTKASGLGPTMRLWLTLSARVVLKYTFPGDNVTIGYFLAPKVDDDSVDPVMSQEEALNLSAKIRSAKEVTSVVMSGASTTNSAPERMSAESTEEASNRKKASSRKTPKTCSDCKQVKACSEYFARQLCKPNGTCIDCVVAACRIRMAKWKEPIPLHFFLSWGRGRNEIPRIRSLGCERYECPMFFLDNNINISEDLQASFRRASPKIDELVGAYDIVYTCSYEGSTHKQRSTRGRLNLTSRLMLDGDGFGLHGVVEMSPLLSDYTVPSGGNFSFVQSVDEACHDFEVPIAVTDYPLGAYSLRCQGESTGTIRLLAERTATGWNPRETHTDEEWLRFYPFRCVPLSPPFEWNPKDNPEEDGLWGDSLDTRIVSFDSADEADVLVKRWKESFVANSWLKNHTALPTELVLKIHEFVAFWPLPAFFFERDDLWISMTWREPDQTVSKTILVARRCK